MTGFWLYPKSRSHDPTTVPHSPSAPSLGSWTQLVLDVRMLTGCDQQGPSTWGWGEARPARKAEGEPKGTLLLLRNASLPLVGHHAHPDQLRLYPLSQFSFQTLGQLLSLHSPEAGLQHFSQIIPSSIILSSSSTLATAYTPAACLGSGVQPLALAFTAA